MGEAVIDLNADHGILEPEDIFSPHHYAQVRQRGPSLRALPLWCYTSDRFFQAEVDRIFLTHWNLLERAEVVPKPGDFHTISFMNMKLIIARGSDDKVRVFANTCRHRGATVAEGKGNCKVFRCPYHAWTYALDGSLVGAPAFNDPTGKPLINETNKQNYGLVEVESGVWGGFVFVKFKAGGPTLAEHLGTFVTLLDSHKIEDMVCTNKLVFDMDANWKCFVENYSDGYHIPVVHQKSLARWGSKYDPPVKPTGNETTIFAKHKGSQLLLPLPGYEGFPAMPQIDDDKKEGTYFTTLRPGVMMTLCNDGALVFQSEPISARKSRLTVSSLFPKATVARNDFEEIAKNYYRRNDIVVGEDKEIALRQFAGILSPFARIPQLCSTETNLHEIANWVLDRVIGPDQSQRAAAE